MPTYQHPGVYIEEIPSASRPIEAAGTSTALIAGFATKGPVSKPTFITSMDQYVNMFGGIVDLHGSNTGTTVDHMGHAVSAFFGNGGSKAYIVRLAGAGSGNTALNKASAVVAMGSATTRFAIAASSEGKWGDSLVFGFSRIGSTNAYNIVIGRADKNGDPLPEEVYGDVTLTPDDAARYFVTQINNRSKLVTVAAAASTAALPDGVLRGTLTSGDLKAFTGFAGLQTKGFTVTLKSGETAAVKFDTAPTSLAAVASAIQTAVRTGAATNPKKDFTCAVVDGKLVMTSGELAANASVAVAATTGTGAPLPCITELRLDTAVDAVPKTGADTLAEAAVAGISQKLGGGGDGVLPMVAEYGSSALHLALRKIRDINMIFLPGKSWKKSDADPDPEASIQAFQTHAERMKNCMLIIDPDPSLDFVDASAFTNEEFPTSTYTCMYYPWVEVANPHFHPELRPDRSRVVKVAPSAFAAGLWARTDSRRGVWKAPAGLQASVLGIARTEKQIGDDEQDYLNPLGVNCLRRVISDTVIWGSRTLATKADPEWRYIPVRRTAMMIEESIYQGIQWAVFEPNDHRLWGSLRLNIENFMGGMFRAGAFQGEKASDAYFVRCGLGDTMTQGDIDAGQVIVIVGFAPLKPAEFVIVRLQQIVGRQ